MNHSYTARRILIIIITVELVEGFGLPWILLSHRLRICGVELSATDFDVLCFNCSQLDGTVMR